MRSGKSIIQAVLDEVGVLRKAADELGAGRLDYRVPVTGRDELGVLARSFISHWVLSHALRNEAFKGIAYKGRKGFDSIPDRRADSARSRERKSSCFA